MILQKNQFFKIKATSTKVQFFCQYLYPEYLKIKYITCSGGRWLSFCYYKFIWKQCSHAHSDECAIMKGKIPTAFMMNFLMNHKTPTMAAWQFCQQTPIYYCQLLNCSTHIVTVLPHHNWKQKDHWELTFGHWSLIFDINLRIYFYV